jgi:hypothetical protein
MISKNPLDELFKDIKRDERLLAQQEARKPRVLIPNPPSTYANPLNWRPGKAVEIRHFEEGSVGVFREYFHRLSPSARRLLPAPQGTLPDTQELVFGEWWLHPRNQAPHIEPDSEAEVRAITQRFNELLDQFLEALDMDQA